MGVRAVFQLCALGLAVFLTPSHILADTPSLNGAPLVLSLPDGTNQSLSIEDLQGLPQHGIRTTTIWTQGMQTFEGARLWDFVQHFDITQGTLELTARNEYFIEIPVDDITPDYGLIAYRMNGGPLSPRGKGPLWLVFDYDSDPTFRQETIYSLSIWQLDRITLVE